MFKGMPKAFWIGMGAVYVYMFVFMILEWTVPGFPLMKFLGIPACWIYNMFIGCYVLNIFVAYYFAIAEEQREAGVAARKKSA